jgi:hypothetical protein
MGGVASPYRSRAASPHPPAGRPATADPAGSPEHLQRAPGPSTATPHFVTVARTPPTFQMVLASEAGAGLSTRTYGIGLAPGSATRSPSSALGMMSGFELAQKALLRPLRPLRPQRARSTTPAPTALPAASHLSPFNCHAPQRGAGARVAEEDEF